MPIYEPDRVEYTISTGHVQIVMDNGVQLPAYWAHPQIGLKFPGVAVVHDWWGLTDIIRRIANLFAQMGHYVIVPDLFNGVTARMPQDAIRLVERLGDHGYPIVHSALSVLETHHHCNEDVAAVGVGLGGSLAFEAAIVRDDLEAAVAFSGFPHRYYGRFKTSNTPICAFYGEQEPHISANDIQRLRDELESTDWAHEIHIINELGHEFFSEALTAEQRRHSREVLKHTLTFLDNHLSGPKRRDSH
jgi:carboxymethylenebutenolidase